MMDERVVVTDEVYKRVESEVLALHQARFSGPPDENDPKSLLEHIKWWQSMRPPGHIADSNAEQLARNVLCYGAQTRLQQRIKALPEHAQKWLNTQLFSQN